MSIFQGHPILFSYFTITFDTNHLGLPLWDISYLNDFSRHHFLSLYQFSWDTLYMFAIFNIFYGPPLSPEEHSLLKLLILPFLIIFSFLRGLFSLKSIFSLVQCVISKFSGSICQACQLLKSDLDRSAKLIQKSKAEFLTRHFRGTRFHFCLVPL